MSETLTTTETEITARTPLCAGRGRLNPDAIGWSRTPLHTCAIPGRWLRRKRWNYWCVMDDHLFFSATVANLDYAGTAFVYTLDYETQTFHEYTVTSPLGRACRLGDTVEERAAFERPDAQLDFEPMDRGTRLRVNAPAYPGGALTADLEVSEPPNHDTLNVVIPWSAKQFQFTSKQHALPAAGTLTIGDMTHTFDAASAFACLDFGRGVWPCQTSWNWGGGAGRQREHIVALNLGGKWTDGTGATENGYFIDGVLTKVGEDLVWEYDPYDFMKPWTIRTGVSNLIHVHFLPKFERVASTNALLIQSTVHQLFGHYEGYVIAPDGRTIAIDGLQGWAEEHHARW